MALDDPLRLMLCASFPEVVRLTQRCRRVAVDMPIGLPGVGQTRDCESAARRLLGPRRHSVFSTPPRRYLSAREFSEVQGMSLQSFHLLPKIRELDLWMTPERQAQVFEAHPELIFTRLGGEPPRHSKKTPEGLHLREKLLGETVESAWPRKLVQPDDVLDALALLRCAQHGVPPLCTQQRDERGLLMQIHGY